MTFQQINGQQVTVKLWDGTKPKNERSGRPDKSGKPAFDRRKKAYGDRKRSKVFADYIPDRKNRAGKKKKY